LHKTVDDSLDEGKKLSCLVGSGVLGPVLTMLCTPVAAASKLIRSGAAYSKFNTYGTTPGNVYVSEIQVVSALRPWMTGDGSSAALRFRASMFCFSGSSMSSTGS